jgi:PhoH-like ATPase
MPAKKIRKIYVLDTSVILFDSDAVKNFEENDVAIPITVLEELDDFKQGSSTKNYEAREFIRFIDRLSGKYTLQDWIQLDGKGSGRFKVIMAEHANEIDAGKIFDANKADHRILNAAFALQEQEPDCRVILVSKDINLRLKSKALGLPAEDYETGKIKDVSNLYSGRSLITGVSESVIDQLFSKGTIPAHAVMPNPPINNHYYILKNGSTSAMAFYNPVSEMMERVEKTSAYGIKPRNTEQAFAMHAIMHPDLRLVSIQGVAGTGKTLLALACSLEQRRNYRMILLARPVIPLSNREMGFLPGDISAKINPYMEPLWDNLKFVKNQFNESDPNYKRIDEMVASEKISITPLAFLRGRSLSKVIFIIDEAQNLTPHEVKTIITRAGEESKLIFTGDIHQIDTPYLDEQSNGLSHMIDKLHGQKLFAHITLEKGERSALANLANQLL